AEPPYARVPSRIPTSANVDRASYLQNPIVRLRFRPGRHPDLGQFGRGEDRTIADLKGQVRAPAHGFSRAAHRACVMITGGDRTRVVELQNAHGHKARLGAAVAECTAAAHPPTLHRSILEACAGNSAAGDDLERALRR